MELDKKIEFVYYGDKFLSIKIGYSLGTVYTIDPTDYHKFKLYNVGYCKATKDFYYNRNIHLPKRLIEYFESRFHSENIEKEMEELGIYKKCDVDRLLDDYNNSMVQSEITKEKTLKLARTLKANKQ